MEPAAPRPGPSGGALGCSAVAALLALALSSSILRLPWQLLDPGPSAGALALGVGLLLALVSSYALRLRRLPGPARRRLLGLLSLALLLAPLVALGSTSLHRVINCALDRSPPSRADAVVVRLAAQPGARRRLVAVLDHTALRESPVEIEVTADTFARLHPGQQVKLETRRGRLGREWCREPCVSAP